MANIKKITKEIEQTIQHNRQQKEQLQRRITTAKASVITAKREMESAAAANDEQAFIAASDKVRFNESVIKTGEAKLAKCEKVPSETVAATIDKVKEAQKEIAAAAEAKAAAAVYDIYVLANKSQADIDELQKLINEYAEETGNMELVTPYQYNGELDKMLHLIKGNKNRLDQFQKDSPLYANI